MADDLIMAVDVGNTRIKFGVFDAASAREGACALPECLASCAMGVTEGKSGAMLGWPAVIGQFGPWQARTKRALVAGVNPGRVERLVADWPVQVWPAAIVVEHAADLPLSVNLPDPDKVGIDRLLDAVAANVLRRPDQAAIVIDSGTATTVDLVSVDGRFEGGAILPGLDLGARALHQYAALLPLIDAPAMSRHTVAALGKNTNDAVESGLWHGQIGAIRELVARFSEAVNRPPLLLVTGGNGSALAAALGDPYRFEPDLALRGLAWVTQVRSA